MRPRTSGRHRGLTEETKGIGLSKVTELVACTAGSFINAACTDATLPEGTLAGAEYWPVELIMPSAALPLTIPLTDHITGEDGVPVIVAVNWVGASPGRAVNVAGVSVMLGWVVEVEEVTANPAQPFARETIRKQSAKFERRFSK
jgi:hypothetical protein